MDIIVITTGVVKGLVIGFLVGVALMKAVHAKKDEY